MKAFELGCTGAAGKSCSRPPEFATWCACPTGDRGTLAGVVFLFCAECLELDLEQDPADEVLELEVEEKHVLGSGDRVAEIRLRPRSS